MKSAVIKCIENKEILVESTGKTISSSCYQFGALGKAKFDIYVATHEQDDITRSIKTHQYVLPEAFSLLPEVVRPGCKVLDLGAHIGTFSLFAAALGYQVLAVEASPLNAALLLESVKQNGFAAMQVIPAAVSDHIGELEFVQAGPYGMVATPLLSGTAISVPAVTVDALLADVGWDTVDFIKMDIEGAEVTAVRGMKHLLAREDAPVIVYESNGHTLHYFGETPASLMASLEDFGYHCYYVSVGILIPWKSTDFQPEVCVDYLATKRPLGTLSHWKLAPPMAAEEKITKILASCADPNKNVRIYIARAMAAVAATMPPDPRIASALNDLKVDSDGDVRSAIEWWQFDQSVSAQIHELYRVLADNDTEITRLRALVQGYENGRFMRMMRFLKRLLARFRHNAGDSMGFERVSKLNLQRSHRTNLFGRVRHLFETDKVVDIFRLVYGRLPNANERNPVVQLPETAQTDDEAGIFRAVINSYNHLALPTPFTVRFSGKDIEYISIQGFQLAIDKTDVSVSYPLLQGIYEPHLIKFFRERLEAGMVFIDVGANIGLYSMLAAQAIGRNGKVFCFEPNSENCRLIMLSAQRNEYESVRVFPFALGNKAGYALFSTHIGSNGGIIPDTQDSLLNPSCIVVPVARLEDMVTDKVNMMKIDVEGAEGLVVEGAKRLIERDRPIVTSEFSLEMLPRVSKISGKDYLHYFVANHYAIYLIDREKQDLVFIDDVDAFVDHYGRPERIEDLAFIPQ